MPQIEEGETPGSFLIDKQPYTVGGYAIKFDDPIKTSTTSNISINQGGTSIANDVLSTWTDNNGNTFTNLGEFWSYIDGFFFFRSENNITVESEADEGLSVLLLRDIVLQLKINNELMRIAFDIDYIYTDFDLNKDDLI
tara:strand:+ start:1827 stop:2243 length:417 start_codon:yes stop_codon:yes gene_type:complete